ncbi:MAG: tripartite tricarboxylate transporter substrate binding protein [Candidimonas sp.]|nr:MAG: tripartite tricarboxylate transporter substrate binding protein [Candidimonas sp.]TAM24408.1 MAG: tripartite tricarboxylate transporter substrate binding protein [Candidimonas sp.]TAM76030.1 MAG: tripartite tricarboxylate transporter substrate binding protein [Candidimonas sp.]
MQLTKTIFNAVKLVLLASLVTPAIAAETWPARPVHVIVPYPAGGGVDFVTRLISRELSKKTGQSFIVENRSGASGAIGAQAVAQSVPDGYTVLIASPAEVLVGQIAGQRTPYNPQTDLVPVSLVGETPLAIVVNPATPANSLSELIALARKNPTLLSYGSPGIGSSMQFAGESLNLIAHISILHVPFKGAAPCIADLLGNQIPMAIVGMPPVISQHKTGKLKILAVTSDHRSSALPDVPTVAELPGFSGYRFTNWMGMYVPKGTPQPIVTKLAKLVGAVVRQSGTRKQLLDQGVEPVGDSPVEFVQFLQSERNRYEAVEKKVHIKID